MLSSAIVIVGSLGVPTIAQIKPDVQVISGFLPRTVMVSPSARWITWPSLDELQRENHENLRRVGRRWIVLDRGMVARDGIEPPTQGFSVLCSTN
jgi:hypothetical protein